MLWIICVWFKLFTTHSLVSKQTVFCSALLKGFVLVKTRSANRDLGLGGEGVRGKNDCIQPCCKTFATLRGVVITPVHVHFVSTTAHVIISTLAVPSKMATFARSRNKPPSSIVQQAWKDSGAFALGMCGSGCGARFNVFRAKRAIWLKGEKGVGQPTGRAFCTSSLVGMPGVDTICAMATALLLGILLMVVYNPN